MMERATPPTPAAGTGLLERDDDMNNGTSVVPRPAGRVRRPPSTTYRTALVLRRTAEEVAMSPMLRVAPDLASIREIGPMGPRLRPAPDLHHGCRRLLDQDRAGAARGRRQHRATRLSGHRTRPTRPDHAPRRVHQRHAPHRDGGPRQRVRARRATGSRRGRTAGARLRPDDRPPADPAGSSTNDSATSIETTLEFDLPSSSA